MKLLKIIVSLLTASMMCCTFTGAAYSETEKSEIDVSSKISTRLLEEYGISTNNLKNASSRKQAVKNSDTEKIPVIVWCTEDINYEAVEKQTLPLLTEDMKSAKQNSVFSLKADVSLDDVLNSREELSEEAIQGFIEAERAASRELYEELNGQFVEKYMTDLDIVYISQYSPVVIAELTLGDVIELAECEATEEFEYYGDENDDEMDKSTKVTRSIEAQNYYNYLGSTVKIGQIESGVPDVTTAQLRSVSNRIHIDSAATNVSEHATRVACILLGQETNSLPKGIAATVADLYCVTTGGGLFQATEKLLTYGVNVINASIVFGEDLPNTYGTYAKWLDHIAINHNVIFVKSSGNTMNNGNLANRGVTSGGMAYNIVTVGNLDDKNTESYKDDIIHYTSSYNNSNSTYAYKPDLCAPGTDISTSVDTSTTMIHEKSGTSFAAPHVTGAIAMMCQVSPSLRLKPATIKAILAASVNSESSYKYCPESWQANPSKGCYAQYGAGLLDVYQSMKNANTTNHHYTSQLETYQSQKSFTMYVTANATVRVALAYLVNNSFNSDGSHTSNDLEGLSTSLLRNLDLYVFSPDGQFITSSKTTNNNVEILEFTPSEDGLYTIKIVNNSLSVPSKVNFGVAWTQ